jgi:hypothetical protein
MANRPISGDLSLSKGIRLKGIWMIIKQKESLSHGRLGLGENINERPAGMGKMHGSGRQGGGAFFRGPFQAGKKPGDRFFRPAE